MNIFVTLGSQKFQFNRLLIALDQLKTGDRVVAQIGASDYKPKNYEYQEYYDQQKFAEIMSRSDIVVTHGGTGAIIKAVKQKKKVIVVPRLARYGEHVDDHQLQIAEAFEAMGIVLVCSNTENLANELAAKISEVKQLQLKEYVSNTQNFISDIETYLENDVFKNT